MRAGSWIVAFLGLAFTLSVVPLPARGQINLKAAAAGRDSTTAAPSPAAPPPAPAGRVRLDLTPLSPDREGDRIFIPARKGAREELSLIGPRDFRAWGRYNRVEGLAVLAELERSLSREDFLPRVLGGFGYAFAARRSQYRLEVEQPVLPRHRVTLGMGAFRSFRPFVYQDEALSSAENSASAFFLHRDYWDWYETEGLRAFVGVYPSPFLSLSFGVVREDESALVNHADWSVFRQTEDFPVNASIVEGQLRAYEVASTFDTRPRGDGRARPAWGAVEHYLRVSWQRADAGLGGDYDLWRASADLRNYFRISARQSLATRVLAATGRNGSGVLPPQYRFALGGLGTLRGHLYRDLHGDHAALANVEYSFDLGGRSRVLVFFDAGTAWDDGTLTDQRIPIDVGTGYRFGQDGITLLLAQTVNESHADPKIYLRLRESF
jgi:hypothetical protein